MTDDTPQRGLDMGDLEGTYSPSGVDEHEFTPQRNEIVTEISPFSMNESQGSQRSRGTRRSRENSASRGVTESQESQLAPIDLGNDINLESSEPMLKKSRIEGGKRKTKKSKKSKKSKKVKKSKKSNKSRRG